MVKWVICAESIASVNFTFTTTIYQQDNSEGYFKRGLLIISRLSVGRTDEASYSIWDSEEWYERYGVLQLDWREVKTGKDDIMLMGGDVRGDWEIYYLHSMACYILTMNNCGKLQEVSNEDVYWMFPQFQAIKETSVLFYFFFWSGYRAQIACSL